MKPVWHIYYATRGAAGSYVDALLKASTAAGVPARAFVSRAYRFKTPNVSKLFFPVTDHLNGRKGLIRALRGIELAAAYVLLTLRLVVTRPRVCLHLIDDLHATFLFFRVCKALGLNVTVTCHDVGSHYLGMNSIRKVILRMADGLIVHNASARRRLIESLGIAGEKIHCYPFPCSKYDEILSAANLSEARENIRRLVDAGGGYYLFLGVVRRSKGIETLLRAWRELRPDDDQRLVIAGTWTDPHEDTRNLAANDSSCVVIDRYLSDEEFVELIRGARFVVLPYLDYAHSSVLIACGNHGGAVIVSDIGLFAEALPDYDLTFPAGDASALARAIESTRRFSATEINERRERLRVAIERENEELVGRLKAAFTGIRRGPTVGFLRAGGRIVRSVDLHRIIGEYPAIGQYQVIQRSRDDVELRYFSDGLREPEMRNFLGKLSELLGSGARVTLKRNAEFIQSPAGKPRTILSLCTDDGDVTTGLPGNQPATRQRHDQQA
ncbi:MAG: glycosyltransferase [Candidatus Zixiibacteriota bacterium]